MAKRENIVERLKQGAYEQGYEIVERLSRTGMGGASRSQVFKAVDRKTNEPLALKASSYGFLDSFEDPDAEKIEDFWNREREVLQLVGNHPNIPSYRGNFIIPENENHHKINVLLMQYLDLKSIEDRIKAGEKISEREAQILLRDGLFAENHLHTGLPYQVLHRDVKPANALLNGEKAYIIDFDIVKQGENDATSQTGVLNLGYYPSDAFGGHPKPEHDVVALGNVAIAGISGKSISLVRGNDVYGLDPIDTNGLLVSPDLKKYLAKLTANNGQRFKTAREALEGLERIVGLPVEVKPKENNLDTKNNSGPLKGRLRLTDGPNGLESFWFGDMFLGAYDTEKQSPYEILKDLRTRTSIEGIDLETDLTRNVTLDYIQYASQKYPELIEVLDGRTSLEDLITNVRKIKDKEERNQKAFGLGLIFSGTPKVLEGSLYDLMDYFPFFSEGKINYINSILAFPIAYPFALTSRNRAKKKAHEMDSWIRDAKVAQGLEKKVEDLELGEEDENESDTERITRLSILSSWLVGCPAFFGVHTLLNAVNLNPELRTPLALVTSISAVGSVATYFGMKKYLTNHTLKKKKEGNMRNFGKFTFTGEDTSSLKKALSEGGLKKKFIKSEFYGENIAIEYSVYRDRVDAQLWASSEEDAKPFAEILDNLKDPYTGRKRIFHFQSRTI